MQNFDEDSLKQQSANAYHYQTIQETNNQKTKIQLKQAPSNIQDIIYKDQNEIISKNKNFNSQIIRQYYLTHDEINKQSVDYEMQFKHTDDFDQYIFGSIKFIFIENNLFDLIKKNQTEIFLIPKNNQRNEDNQQNIRNYKQEYKLSSVQLFNYFNMNFKVSKGGDQLYKIFNQNNNYQKIYNNEKLNSSSSENIKEINDHKKNENITIQFNPQKKLLTYLKKVKNQSDKETKTNKVDPMSIIVKQKEVIEKLEQKSITLPLINFYETQNIFEQKAGQKDFKIIKNNYKFKILDENGMIKYNQLLEYLFCRVLYKLTLLHEEKYVHFDVKPKNIVIGFDSDVYFIDFEGASRLEDKVQFNNYFTEYFNLDRFIPKDNVINNLNEFDACLCDLQQLAISFIYMTIFDNQQKEQFFQKKNFEDITQKNKTKFPRLCPLLEQIIKYAKTPENILEIKSMCMGLFFDYTIINQELLFLQDIIYNEKEEKQYKVQRINKYSIEIIYQIDYSNLVINPRETYISYFQELQNDDKFNELFKYYQLEQYYNNLIQQQSLSDIDLYNQCYYANKKNDDKYFIFNPTSMHQIKYLLNFFSSNKCKAQSIIIRQQNMNFFDELLKLDLIGYYIKQFEFNEQRIEFKIGLNKKSTKDALDIDIKIEDTETSVNSIKMIDVILNQFSKQTINMNFHNCYLKKVSQFIQEIQGLYKDEINLNKTFNFKIFRNAFPKTEIENIENKKEDMIIQYLYLELQDIIGLNIQKNSIDLKTNLNELNQRFDFLKLKFQSTQKIDFSLQNDEQYYQIDFDFDKIQTITIVIKDHLNEQELQNSQKEQQQQQNMQQNTINNTQDIQQYVKQYLIKDTLNKEKIKETSNQQIFYQEPRLFFYILAVSDSNSYLKAQQYQEESNYMISFLSRFRYSIFSDNDIVDQQDQTHLNLNSYQIKCFGINYYLEQIKQNMENKEDLINDLIQILFKKENESIYNELNIKESFLDNSKIIISFNIVKKLFEHESSNDDFRYLIKSFGYILYTVLNLNKQVQLDIEGQQLTTLIQSIQQCLQETKNGFYLILNLKEKNNIETQNVKISNSQNIIEINYSQFDTTSYISKQMEIIQQIISNNIINQPLNVSEIQQIYEDVINQLKKEELKNENLNTIKKQ